MNTFGGHMCSWKKNKGDRVEKAEKIKVKRWNS
jgi:hypothetical protein